MALRGYPLCLHTDDRPVAVANLRVVQPIGLYAFNTVANIPDIRNATLLLFLAACVQGPETRN